MILTLDEDYDDQHLSVVSHDGLSYVGLLRKDRPVGGFLDSHRRYRWYPVESDMLVEILWGEFGVYILRDS